MLKVTIQSCISHVSSKMYRRKWLMIFFYRFIGNAHSVMILNRPGCELYEMFLRDLAFILSTYGIDVKLALLEQTSIDADGGIPCYLQRNIESCDYIFIIFNVRNQGRILHQ